MNHNPAVSDRYHDIQTFRDAVSRIQDDSRSDRGLLRITLAGGVFLSFDGQDISLPNRKARAMLAVLALNSPPEESRERLTGLLWSESEQSRAHATLRQAVHETRQTLAAVGCNALVAGRLTVALRPGSFQVDMTEMLTELEAGVPDLVPRNARLMDVLLSGLDDLDPSFTDWVATRRQNLHDRLLRALTNAFRDSRTPRRQRRALAEAALLQDPASEEACRTVMRCAAEDGETGAALRAYEVLYRYLGEDFDMEPSMATQTLVAAIKQGEFDVVEAKDLQ
jgi:DNA-binding SARP family transcriptional activator